MTESLNDVYASNFSGFNWDKAIGHMKVLESSLLQPGQLVIMNPTTYQQIKPVELEWPTEPFDYGPLKFKVMQDFGVKLSVPRSSVMFTYDIGGFDKPRVEWPEPVVPAQPLSWWQWLVVVGFLSWVLCALSRAV